MAITIDKVLKSMSKKYRLELIAGDGGRNNLVQWLSSVENMAVIPYVRERELAVITGFANNSEAEIMSICRQLCEERHTCGLMINIGPYIESIPETVEDYCRENNFPLIIFPWEVRIIDIINESTKLILKSDSIEESNHTIFKNIMFRNNLRQSSYDLLERRGLGEDHFFDIILVKLFDKKKDIDELKHNVERIVVWSNQKYVLVRHNDHVIVFLIDKEEVEIESFTQNLYQSLEKKYGESAITIVIGPHETKMSDIPAYYPKLNLAAKMQETRDKKIIKYEELGVYGLLLDIAGVSGHNLEAYYHGIMGKLEEYDKDNHTELVAFIWKYISLEGNIQEMASDLYVHRNTITNNIKKISGISGLDLYNWEDRFSFQLCKYIKNMYQL